MNIQPGGTIRHRSLPKQECRQWLGKMWFSVKVIAYLIVLAAILNAHIWLRQQTTVAERKIRKVNSEINSMQRELENLRIKSARLSSWPHIRERIAYFNLKLRVPEPGQVQRIAFLTPTQAAKVQLPPLPQRTADVSGPSGRGRWRR